MDYTSIDTYTRRVIIEKYPPTKKIMLKWIEEHKIKSVRFQKFKDAVMWRDLENRIGEKFGKHFNEESQQEYFKLYEQIS